MRQSYSPSIIGKAEEKEQELKLVENDPLKDLIRKVR
jgi:hypothetical protein